MLIVISGLDELVATKPLRCNTTGIVAPANIATKAEKLRTASAVMVKTFLRRVEVANM